LYVVIIKLLRATLLCNHVICEQTHAYYCDWNLAIMMLFVNRHMHIIVNGISVMWISIAAAIISVVAMSIVNGTSGKHVLFKVM
jgi:hypothetical protein